MNPPKNGKCRRATLVGVFVVAVPALVLHFSVIVAAGATPHVLSHACLLIAKKEAGKHRGCSHLTQCTPFLKHYTSFWLIVKKALQGMSVETHHDLQGWCRATRCARS